MAVPSLPAPLPWRGSGLPGDRPRPAPASLRPPPATAQAPALTTHLQLLDRPRRSPLCAFIHTVPAWEAISLVCLVNMPL